MIDFFRFLCKSDNISLKSNKLKTLDNKITEIIATPPPITAEKKLVKKDRQMLDIKCPKRLDGAMISEYLKDKLIKLIFKFGIAFLIFIMFNNEINVIDKKNDTIMLLILIIGVKTIKLTNKTIEPIM